MSKEVLHSSSKILHAFSADVQHATNNTLLSVTALANGIKAASTVAAWHVQASTPIAETIIHASHQFLNLGAPILAMIDGASRFALGFTDIIFALYYDDNQLTWKKTSKSELLLEGFPEMVKSIPEFCGAFQAWQGASVNLGPLGQFASINLVFLGLAVTNSLDCLTDFVRLIQHYRENLKVGEDSFEYKHDLWKDFIKLMVKGLESAGWWLLACGNPLLGAAFLAVVAAYKICEGSLCRQVKADVGRLGLFDVLKKKEGNFSSSTNIFPKELGAPSWQTDPLFNSIKGAAAVIRSSR